MNNEALKGSGGVEGGAPADERGSKPGRTLLKTGFLMLTSALLGGVAFALWNRRQISNFQQEEWKRPPEEAHSDDDSIY